MADSGFTALFSTQGDEATEWKGDISILCEILLHFISVFFFFSPNTYRISSSQHWYATCKTSSAPWLVFQHLEPGFFLCVCVWVVFSRVLDKTTSKFFREEKRPVGRPTGAKLCACVCRSLSVLAGTQTCRAETWKNNSGCWPSAKCQRRLWELLEIRIERATFPRVQELVSQQPTRRDQQGHATSCRQTGKLLKLRQHFPLQRPSWQNPARCYFPTICTVYMLLLGCFFERFGT